MILSVQLCFGILPLEAARCTTRLVLVLNISSLDPNCRPTDVKRGSTAEVEVRSRVEPNLRIVGHGQATDEVQDGWRGDTGSLPLAKLLPTRDVPNGRPIGLQDPPVSAGGWFPPFRPQISRLTTTNQSDPGLPTGSSHSSNALRRRYRVAIGVMNALSHRKRQPESCWWSSGNLKPEGGS